MRRLGPIHANNGLANVPFRPQCKEEGAPFGRAKQATPDAAMRAERHVPLIKKTFAGLAARRADRRVMLLANTSSIRFVPQGLPAVVAILALGPSGGQRKPVISVNRPYAFSRVNTVVMQLPPADAFAYNLSIDH
jgi:hypothetical protein